MSVLLLELIRKTNESINQKCHKKKKKNMLLQKKKKKQLIMTVESQLVH